MELIDNGFFIGIFQLLIIVIALLTVVIFVTALVSIVKNEFKNNDKLIWLLVVLFLPFLGSILYFIIGRKTRILKNEDDLIKS